MKVLLINGRFNGAYSDALGIAYLASVLRENAIEVVLMDPTIDKMSPEECARQAAKHKPYLIGISVISIEYRKDVFSFMEALRSNHVYSHICAGGRDPSMSFSEYLRNGLLDSVVIGEGELTFLKLAQTLKSRGDWKNVSGLCHVENGEIIFGLPGDRIDDVNQIPFASRDMLKLYRENNPDHDMAQILGSRGCYAHCSFCTSPTFDRLHKGKRIRLRDVSNIVEEMRYVYDTFGVKHFDFVDDVFLLPGSTGPRRAQEFKELLNSDSREITFNVQMRADTVQKDVIKDLKSAGLIDVFLGIENFEDQSLAIYQKGADSEVYDRALNCLSDVGFKTEVDARYRVRVGMLTFHAETTLETLKIQLQSVKRWGLPSKRLRGFVIPFDGTEIRRRYEEKGLLTGTPFKPSFKFESKDVEIFFQHWKPFIDRLTHLTDRIRDVEKGWIRLNRKKDDNLIRARKFLDSIGFYVFEQLIEMLEQRKGEKSLDSFIKSQNEYYDAYWRSQVHARLETHEQLLLAAPKAKRITTQEMFRHYRQ